MTYDVLRRKADLLGLVLEFIMALIVCHELLVLIIYLSTLSSMWVWTYLR